MRFGVVFPQTEFNGDAAAIRDYAVTVEGQGFSHIAAYDHVLGANPDRPGGWKGTYTYHHPFHEVFGLFSYLAALTRTIEFVTDVLILPQRQTALVAKQAATLDFLCGGRFRLGVGLGWNEVEYVALNENFHTRGRRIAELSSRRTQVGKHEVCQQEFLEHIVSSVLKHRQQELKALERNTKFLENVKKPLPKISYTEAVEILKKKNVDFTWGNDFGGADETVISEQFDRPVIVHRYPAQIKAFYMKRDPQNPELALAMDVLAPEGYGEIIGGSQREDDLDALLHRLQEHHLPQSAFEWYLDLRRFGSVPHAGFGLGIERTVAWICGLEHVRETIPFPRMIYRLTP